MKNMINDILQQYYNKELFRKLKWYDAILRLCRAAKSLDFPVLIYKQTTE